MTFKMDRITQQHSKTFISQDKEAEAVDRRVLAFRDTEKVEAAGSITPHG